MPGTGLCMSCAWRECPHTASMSSATGERSSAAARKASPTGMGEAVPTKASFASRSPCFNAVSSAMRDPMLCPTSETFARLAASRKAATHCDHSSIVERTAPGLRP